MGTFLKEFRHEFTVALREAPRIYFAPFVGAFRGTRAEYADIEIQRKLAHDQAQKASS